jgi:hypothetical protein
MPSVAALNQVSLMRPGMASILIPIAGKQAHKEFSRDEIASGVQQLSLAHPILQLVTETQDIMRHRGCGAPVAGRSNGSREGNRVGIGEGTLGPRRFAPEHR